MGKGAISESDNEKIMMHSQRKDKIRYLIHRFRHYGPDKFELFLKLLRTEYPDLKSDLEKAYEEKTKLADQNICLFCKITQTVDMSDILDPLFEQNLINDFIVEHKLNCGSLPHNSLWSQLFQQLKGVSSITNCKDVLVEALTPKYIEIANEVKCGNLPNVFACSCHKLFLSNSLLTDGSGSLSDISSQSSSSDKQLASVEKVTKTLPPGITKKVSTTAWEGRERNANNGPSNQVKRDRSQSEKRRSEVKDSTRDSTIQQEQDGKFSISGKHEKQVTKTLHEKPKLTETPHNWGKPQQRKSLNLDQSVDRSNQLDNRDRPVSEKMAPEPQSNSNNFNSYTKLPSINDRGRSGKSDRETGRSTSQDKKGKGTTRTKRHRSSDPRYKSM